MENFNGLTPAETERLAILVEECGEVVQIGMKILRHGYRSYHPEDTDQTSNATLLATELGHVRYALSEMIRHQDIPALAIELSSQEKMKNIKKYLHHQAI